MKFPCKNIEKNLLNINDSLAFDRASKRSVFVMETHLEKARVAGVPATPTHNINRVNPCLLIAVFGH